MWSMVAVCGSDYQDALKNICTNLPCPEGDVSVGIFVLHAFGARLDVVSCLFLLSRRFGPESDSMWEVLRGRFDLEFLCRLIVASGPPMDSAVVSALKLAANRLLC